jgi:CheY-like chemotaxis protein
MKSTRCLKVLIVDDDPILGEMFVDILQMGGHEGRLARSGHQALTLLAAERFDVIVSDLRMPGMGGRELWEHLHREDPATAGRVVFVSAEHPGDANGEFLRGCGQPFLQKPFSIEALLQTVQKQGLQRLAG